MSRLERREKKVFSRCSLFNHKKKKKYICEVPDNNEPQFIITQRNEQYKENKFNSITTTKHTHRRKHNMKPQHRKGLINKKKQENKSKCHYCIRKLHHKHKHTDTHKIVIKQTKRNRKTTN
jgi:hypothetical protein